MSYYVIFDDPSRGGDGTYLTDSEGEDLWSHDRERARIMTQTEAEVALDDVDADEILRDRLRIMHASHFKLPILRAVSANTVSANSGPMADVSLDTVRRSFDDLVATIRAMPPAPPLEAAGFLVAPDVWDRLKATIPIVRGASLTVGALYVKQVRELTQGAIVPVDAKGKPLLRPFPRVVEVACPYCNARPFAPCTDVEGSESAGRHGGYHLKRIEAARSSAPSGGTDG